MTLSSTRRRRLFNRPNTPLRMVVSRTRPASEAVAVARALGAELLPMGSAGAKAMAVVRGEADILPALGRPERVGQLRSRRGRPGGRATLLARRWRPR